MSKRPLSAVNTSMSLTCDGINGEKNVRAIVPVEHTRPSQVVMRGGQAKGTLRVSFRL